jgi:hypothetical protein
MDEVMTEENLRDTYGGQLDVLSRAAETVEQHGQ